MALLEIKDLHVEYKTGKACAYALNGVNLSIERGEALGLVGETGAGKTTTALSTLKLLPHRVGRVTQGSITYDGQDILNMSEQQMTGIRGKKIAMIFQNPLSSLNPVFTVQEQITMVLRKHSDMSKADAIKRAGELLEMVGLASHRLKDYPYQFSGGMRQRVGIAAALACDPELLIADEPTTALDVTIQAQILELMKKIQKEQSGALLMITHNLGIIAELCNRVAVMYGGVIVEMGPVKEVFKNPQHWYTKGLMAAVPRLDIKQDRLESIPGFVVDPQVKIPGCRFAPRCRACTEECKKTASGMRDVGNGHFVACYNLEG